MNITLLILSIFLFVLSVESKLKHHKKSAANFYFTHLQSDDGENNDGEQIDGEVVESPILGYTNTTNTTPQTSSEEPTVPGERDLTPIKVEGYQVYNDLCNYDTCPEIEIQGLHRSCPESVDVYYYPETEQACVLVSYLNQNLEFSEARFCNYTWSNKFNSTFIKLNEDNEEFYSVTSCNMIPEHERPSFCDEFGAILLRGQLKGEGEELEFEPNKGCISYLHENRTDSNQESTYNDTNSTESNYTNCSATNNSQPEYYVLPLEIISECQFECPVISYQNYYEQVEYKCPVGGKTGNLLLYNNGLMQINIAVIQDEQTYKDIFFQTTVLQGQYGDIIIKVGHGNDYYQLLDCKQEEKSHKLCRGHQDSLLFIRIELKRDEQDQITFREFQECAFFVKLALPNEQHLLESHKTLQSEIQKMQQLFKEKSKNKK